MLCCAGVNIGKYLCSADKTVVINETISTVARAVAEATAVTSVTCTVTGSGSGTASATAKAEANATATAEAIGRGLLSVETCNGCKAEAEVFVEAATSAFVKAVAESESKVHFLTLV